MAEGSSDQTGLRCREGVQGRITYELAQFLAERTTFELGLGLG